MVDALFESEIECSLTMLGKDVAKVVVWKDRLEFTKLKILRDIPSLIKIAELMQVKYLITKYFDFKISIRYMSGGQEKTFDFVTCNNASGSVGAWEGVSDPIKTFRLYRLLKKLIKEVRPGK